jgi:EmrB/QacA subfamily drug resistance transporter
MTITAMGIKDSHRSRWIALVVVCCAQFMSVVDATIVNVALPSIQRSLRFSQQDLTWVVNSYLISYGSFLLLAGRLGDLIGRRRVFLVGVAVFTLASAACGLATSSGMLIAARFVQGFGGAGATSAIVAIVATEFPEPSERAKAMSVYMFVISGGASLGLLAGGVITQWLTWHWIFFINVPVGIATFLAARVWVRENQAPGIGRDVDWQGSVLVTGAMMLLAYAIVTSTSYGWGSAHTLGLAGVSLALLAGFAAREARLANPIMPLRVFRIPGLASSSLVRGLLIAGMYTSLFIGVLYLQHILGYTPLGTGFAYLPQALLLAALSLGVTAWLINRFGPFRPLLAGLVICCAGLLWLSRASAHASFPATVMPALIMIGTGSGLAMLPLLIIAMARVPPADAGMASGIINTSLQLSAALGVAVLGTVSTQRTRTLLAQGQSHTAALLGGYHLAFAIAAGCVGIALIVTLVLLRKPAHAARSSRAVTVEPVGPALEAEAA